MCSATLEKRGESKNNNLRNIFDTMAYNDGDTGNLTSIKKWLGESQKNVLSSCINGTLIGDDSTTQTIRLEGLSQAIGTDVKVKLLNNEAKVIDAYRSIYKTESGTVKLATNALLERRTRFQDLLKNKSKDLVQLEAYAGNVPAWIVQKQDQPTWLEISNGLITAEIRKQLEAGNSQVLLRLEEKSYCLKNVVALLSAVVQVDGHVLVFISPSNDSNIRQLLPVIHLIDAINASRIRNQQIGVLLVASELLRDGLLKKLAVVDESLKLKTLSEVIELGDLAIRPASIVTTAARNLSISNGSSIHYVVDSSADIASAISSLSRNVWSCGIEINHRCRSLAFVHQAVYAQVVNELKETVEKIKVDSWNTNALTNCDFVSRKVDGLSSALSCVGKLGAKLIAIKPDYSVPTVVYDIGTSSDLVSIKETGLGHILVLIPYRSLNELFSLGNNFGVPDELFLYSNCFISSMPIIKKINAAEILVNSASQSLRRSSLFWLPWQVVSKSGTGNVKKGCGNTAISTAKPEANKWRELSSSTKIEKLNQLVKATEVDPAILSELLSYYLDNAHENALSVPSTSGQSCSGIVLADAAEVASSNIITALIACVLRDRPVVIVSPGTEFPSVIANAVKEHFPAGLVSFLVVESVEDIKAMTVDWELVWIFQGSKKYIQLDIVQPNFLNRVLLVNSPSDNEPKFNSKLAVATAYKICQI